MESCPQEEGMEQIMQFEATDALVDVMEDIDQALSSDDDLDDLDDSVEDQHEQQPVVVPT